MAYTTTHNTAERLMEHKFDNGYSITTNFNFNIAYVELNGKSNSFSIEDMSIEEYQLILEKYGND